jgi:hypothetical protein
MNPALKQLVGLHKYMSGAMEFRVTVESLNSSMGSLIVGYYHKATTMPATIDLTQLYANGFVEIPLNVPQMQQHSFTLHPTSTAMKLLPTSTESLLDSKVLVVAIKTPHVPTFPEGSTVISMTVFNRAFFSPGSPWNFSMGVWNDTTTRVFDGTLANNLTSPYQAVRFLDLIGERAKRARMVIDELMHHQFSIIQMPLLARPPLD